MDVSWIIVDSVTTNLPSIYVSPTTCKALFGLGAEVPIPTLPSIITPFKGALIDPE